MNLLQFSGFVDGATTQGITFNKVGNGIVASGSATGEGICDIDRHLSLTKGKYYYGGCYSDTPWLQIMDDNNQSQIGDSRWSSPVLTIQNDADVYVRFHVSNNVTYSGVMTPFLCRIS